MRTTSPHIVLVGRPGVGKSSIGFALSRRLHRPFFDSDNHPERMPQHPGRATEEDEAACREWIRVIGATSMPAVVAAPWVGVDEILADDPVRNEDLRPWIVVLDADDSVLDERVGPIAEGDREDGGAVDERLARLREVAGAELDTSDDSVQDHVEALIAAWGDRIGGHPTGYDPA